MSDIADNEPRVYNELLLEIIEASSTIAKHEKLTTSQKLAYMELLSGLSCNLPNRVIKNIGNTSFIRKSA